MGPAPAGIWRGVSPDHGPLAGGTAVAITGTNFQGGCTVTFGAVAATDVVVVDPQTITCTTPAHYPAVVDVAVTNPNLAVGTMTRGFTHDGTPTIVTLPTTAHDRMSVTTLGITTPGADGMISATFEFTYDPAVLAVQTTGTGSLTSGWSVSSNTATPGSVRLSLAGTAAVTGLITLQPRQQIAGDVDRSGVVDALDASYLLQHAVGLIPVPFPGAGRVWTFEPPSCSHVPLVVDQTGQDFTAILIVDVTGNWGDDPGKGLPGTATLEFAEVPACGEGTAVIALGSLEPGTDLYAVELTVTFDPAVAQLGEVRRGALTSAWSLLVNDHTAGELRVALAGASPVTDLGDLLEIDFLAGGGRATWLAASRILLNEGLVDAGLLPVEANSCPVFGNGFEEGSTAGWSSTVPVVP